jgi:hypothetical protein
MIRWQASTGLKCEQVPCNPKISTTEFTLNSQGERAELARSF